MLQEKKSKRGAWIALGCVAALLVLVIVLENTMQPTSMLFTVLKKGAVYALVAASLNLLNGFTGLFSLGQAGFMLLGAYTYAILTIPSADRESVYYLYGGSAVNFSLPELFGGGALGLILGVLAALILAGCVAAVIAWLIGLPVLRLKSDYLAIATLGFAEIIRVVIVNATSITNGSLGIKGIPGEATLLTCYIWTVITLVVLSRLIFSNFGNVLRCIRDNEIAAGVMGINVFRYKVLSFCVGAFFAGVGGALLGSHLSTIDPKMFNFLLTFNVLMFVVAGGLGSLTGSLLGATIVTILLEWLRAIEEPMDFGVFEIPGIPGMRMVVFSLILLAIILFRREGIMGTREITWKTIFSLGRRKA